MGYFIHYNMNIGGEETTSLKDAIRLGYRYLKDHPTSRKTLNIFYFKGAFTKMDKNVGIMYWDNVGGKRKVVFDSSNDKPGTYNVVRADGTLEKKIANRHTLWKMKG